MWVVAAGWRWLRFGIGNGADAGYCAEQAAGSRKRAQQAEGSKQQEDADSVRCAQP